MKKTCFSVMVAAFALTIGCDDTTIEDDAALTIDVYIPADVDVPDTNYAGERDANVPPIDCTGNLEPCMQDSDCAQPKVQSCVAGPNVCWDPRCSGTP